MSITSCCCCVISCVATTKLWQKGQAVITFFRGLLCSKEISDGSVTFGTNPWEIYSDIMYLFILCVDTCTHIKLLIFLSFVSSCLWRFHHQAERFDNQSRLAPRVPPKQELHLAAGCPHAVPYHSALWRLRDWGQWCEIWGYVKWTMGGFVLYFCSLSLRRISP